MGSLNDNMELKILNEIWGGTNYAPVATMYLALYTAAPNDAGGGTEASYTGYSRVSITNNTTNWPAAAAGSKNNGVAFTFGTNTGTPTQTVSHVVFYTSATATTEASRIAWGTLTASKPIAQNDIPKFNATTGITITLD